MKSAPLLLLLPLTLLAATGWKAREFETIRMVNHRGEVSKVHLVSRVKDQLYLVSEKETIYRFDLTHRRLSRLLLSMQSLKEMEHFVALSKTYLLFSKKDKLFAVELPKLYLKELQPPVPGAVINHLFRLDASTAILTYQDRVVLFQPEGGLTVPLPLPQQIHGWSRAFPMPDGRLWLFALGTALELVPGATELQVGRHFTFSRGRSILAAGGEGVFLLNKTKLLKIAGKSVQGYLTVKDGRGLFSDASRNVWVYGKDQLLRLPSGDLDRAERYPLPFSELSSLLYAGIDSTGDLILVSPEYLTLVHDFQKGEPGLAIVQGLASLGEADLWCFYHSQIDRDARSLQALNQSSLLERSLSLLARACLYYPEVGYQLAPQLAGLPDPMERIRLARRIGKAVAGTGWAFALHLSNLQQHWTRSVEDKIRTQMDQARLLAQDTANFPLAALKLQEALAHYGQVIFQDNVRDSLTFFRLKYSPGFPFARHRELESLWETLQKQTHSPLLKRFVHMHFFDRESRRVFQISQAFPTRLDTLAVREGAILATSDRDGLWLLSGKELQFFKDRVPIHTRNRNRYRQLLRWNNRALGLTRTGELQVLNINGSGKFTPSPPQPLSRLWLAGQSLIGMARGSKKHILQFESTQQNWQLVGSLPATIPSQQLLYLAPLSGGFYLLVTPSKAYRIHPVNQTTEGISLPPQVVTIYDCVKDSRGGFYFATNSGLWYFTVTGQWNHVSRRDGLPEGDIFSLDYQFSKSVLACLGKQMAGMLDASGWILWPLNRELEPSPATRVLLDGQLNAYLLFSGGCVKWTRSQADLKNLVDRLLRLEARTPAAQRESLLMPLVQRATRIQALSQWGAAYQLRLQLMDRHYGQATDLLQVALSRGKDNPWLTPLDALVLLDLMWRDRNWPDALQAFQALSPFLNQGTVAGTAIGYLFQQLDAYGPGYFPKEKLELAIQLSRFNLSSQRKQRLERLVHQLVSRLYVERAPDLLNQLNRLLQAFPGTRYEPVWKLYTVQLLAELGRYGEAMAYLPTPDTPYPWPDALKPVFARLYWRSWLNHRLETKQAEAGGQTQ